MRLSGDGSKPCFETGDFHLHVARPYSCGRIRNPRALSNPETALIFRIADAHERPIGVDSGLARSIAERLLLTGRVRRAPFHYDCQLPRCPPSNGDTQHIRPMVTIGLARVRTTLKPADIVVGARCLKATYPGNLGRGMMAKTRPSTTGHLPDPPVTQPETGAHPCRSRTPKAPAN